jgi:HlyD family secretion protein
MKRWLIPFIALVALAFTTTKAYEWRWRRESSPPPADPAQVTFPHTVAAVGLVEPSSENIAISTPVPGLVMAVHVKVGDRVPRGAPLFALDDRDLRAELTLRKRNLEVARARLARLEHAPRPEELPPAQAKVRAAEAALADAQNNQRLMESIPDKRAVREEELLQRREATNMAAARLQEAKASLALLQAGTWRRDLEVSRTEVAYAEVQVHRVEADLERLTVRAPMDGEILQLNVRRGEYAPVGQLPKPLLVMGDVGQLHVRADIDEHEAWRVQPGGKAEAVERGNSSRRAALEFVRFEPYVIPKKSLTGDSTERVDTRVLQVIYRFTEPSGSLYVGQQMDIFIEATLPAGFEADSALPPRVSHAQRGRQP